MSCYPLHELNDEEFQDMTTRICRKILGIGTTSFCPGRDKGKDAKFEGKANSFPSESRPADGSFVIQAKHTTNPVASCSDPDFYGNKSSVVNKEIAKIKTLVEKEGVNYYLLFTNRKKTGGIEATITEYIKKATGLQQAWVLGKEDVDHNLRDFPTIASEVGLDKLRSPIRFTPEDIRDVIIEFHMNKGAIGSAFDNQHDFQDYPGIEKKNRINGLSHEYFDYIKSDSLPLFTEIDAFLKNPRNSSLGEKYYAVTDELKGQIITHRAEFRDFDEALEHVFQLMYERSSILQQAPHRRLTKIFVHYMYCSCDIGEKQK